MKKNPPTRLTAALRLGAGLTVASLLIVAHPHERDVPRSPARESRDDSRFKPEFIPALTSRATANDIFSPTPLTPEDFARTAAAALTTPPPDRCAQLNAAYYEWARHEPELALESALRVADPGDRAIAFESALSGWSRGAPAELAEAALAFPDGAEKTAALTKAIRAWMIADPWNAGDWLLAHPPAVPIAEFVFRTENR